MNSAKKKKIILILVGIVLIIALTAWLLVTRGGSDDVDQSDWNSTEDSDDLTESDDEELIEREDGNGITFDEETDGVEVALKARDVSDFYGEWEATSDQGLYLYGSIDLTVNKDGTWKGNITGEPLSGTYDVFDDHLHMNNSIFSFDLAYSDSGNLMLIDTDSDDEIRTVLTRK